MKEGEGVIKHKVQTLIISLQGKQVMIDSDLAEMYQVTTKVLNQAVKRNIDRFSTEFRFQISSSDKTELVANCDRFKYKELI